MHCLNKQETSRLTVMFENYCHQLLYHMFVPSSTTLCTGRVNRQRLSVVEFLPAPVDMGHLKMACPMTANVPNASSR